MLMLAAIYILVSLGFAFLFNILGFFNISHSAIYMASGYLGYFLIVALGINQWLGFLLVVIIIALFGILLEKFCIRPFQGDFNRQIMIGLAIMLFLATTVNIVIGSQHYALPRWVEGVLSFGSYSVELDRIMIFLIGASILTFIIIFVNHTKWGLQMQAITQNAEAAALQGININRVAMLVSALACGLAAVAGVLVGSMWGLDPFMGQNTLVKILIIVILAGIGNFQGIFFTGLILGVLYGGLPVLISGAASDAVAITIVCVILLFRPQGFFGYET
jgi:branched-chain amino acid transport system permease protein